MEKMGRGAAASGERRDGGRRDEGADVDDQLLSRYGGEHGRTELEVAIPESMQSFLDLVHRRQN